MSTVTPNSAALRTLLSARRDALNEILDRYGASNPRMFGSVARDDAGPQSDLDIRVDLAPGKGNELLRVAGTSEELGGILGRQVDVVAASLLRTEVSATALADAAPV